MQKMENRQKMNDPNKTYGISFTKNTVIRYLFIEN